MPRECSYRLAEAADIEENQVEQSLSKDIRMTNQVKSVLAIIGGSVFVVLASFLIAILADSHHTIEEGNVGIYFKFGALQEEVTMPGVHWKAPFVTMVEEVKVRPKTDTLNLMSTVTKDGITNTFNDVQVISRIKVKSLIKMVRTFGMEFRNALIFDRVKEELRIFCANSTVDEVYNTK